ncbi:hypothetical protein ADU37_CDS00340 [Thermococcus sp. 2319x1]|nr:hypothetical protein ADU37_CDS00340 [Thermococcus sp. 2319x1]
MPPSFPPDIRPTVLRNPAGAFGLTPTGLSPSSAPRSSGLRLHPRGSSAGPYYTTSPECFHSGFSLPCAAFGRPYSRHRFCFLFLRVLRCFNSPRSPSLRSAAKPQEVPFGNPRLDGCLRLTGAYRSLPRPSSAPRAEPSTRRLRFLTPYLEAGHFLGQIHLCTVLIVTPYSGPRTLPPRALLGMCTSSWWTGRDLNPGPPACKAGALPG